MGAGAYTGRVYLRNRGQIRVWRVAAYQENEGLFIVGVGD